MSMMRAAVMGCLVLVCIVALLAEQVEGHITFFSPKEMREFREKEGKKDPGFRAESVLTDEVSPVEDGADQHVELGVKLTVKKGPVGSELGKMLQKILEEPQTEK